MSVGDQQWPGLAGRRGRESMPVDQPYAGFDRIDPQPGPHQIEERHRRNQLDLDPFVGNQGADRLFEHQRRPRNGVQHLAVLGGRRHEPFDDRRVHVLETFGIFVQGVERIGIGDEMCGRVDRRAEVPGPDVFDLRQRLGGDVIDATGSEPDHHDARQPTRHGQPIGATMLTIGSQVPKRASIVDVGRDRKTVEQEHARIAWLMELTDGLGDLVPRPMEDHVPSERALDRHRRDTFAGGQRAGHEVGVETAEHGLQRDALVVVAGERATVVGGGRVDRSFARQRREIGVGGQFVDDLLRVGLGLDQDVSGAQHTRLGRIVGVHGSQLVDVGSDGHGDRLRPRRRVDRGDQILHAIGQRPDGRRGEHRGLVRLPDLGRVDALLIEELVDDPLPDHRPEQRPRLLGVDPAADRRCGAEHVGSGEEFVGQQLEVVVADVVVPDPGDHIGVGERGAAREQGDDRCGDERSDEGGNVESRRTTYRPAPAALARPPPVRPERGFRSAAVLAGTRPGTSPGPGRAGSAPPAVAGLPCGSRPSTGA